MKCANFSLAAKLALSVCQMPTNASVRAQNVYHIPHSIKSSAEIVISLLNPCIYMYIAHSLCQLSLLCWRSVRSFVPSSVRLAIAIAKPKRAKTCQNDKLPSVNFTLISAQIYIYTICSRMHTHNCNAIAFSIEMSLIRPVTGIAVSCIATFRSYHTRH